MANTLRGVGIIYDTYQTLNYDSLWTKTQLLVLSTNSYIFSRD
jgi:hypothetical protein